jgi:hypothetical protein
MSKLKFAAFLGGAIMAIILGSNALSPIQASAETAPIIGCTDGVKSGNDNCTLPTGVFVALDGTDWMYPGANVEINDMPKDTKQIGVTGVGELDPNIAYVSGSFDSTGYETFGIYISYGYAEQFEFTYTDGNNVEHMVTVTPYTRPLAAAPTVTKTSRKGVLKACEPSIENGGDYVYAIFGSFKLAGPDGELQLNPGACQTFRVHRHRIDVLAFDAYNGMLIAELHVTHIKLPKGDQPPVIDKRPMAKPSTQLGRYLTMWQHVGN